MKDEKFFLTKHEMCELTGYTTLTKQIEWLHRNQWAFALAHDTKNPKRNGKQVLVPKVARAYALQKMGVGIIQVPVEQKWEPDFSDLRNGTASV